VIARGLIALIRVYQKTAPWRPPVCRFLPTCSQYAVDAIQRYGPARGSLMAAGRICRCHPLSRGGYDPVR
jgi:putative membrane protein insertion efficiency factor